MNVSRRWKGISTWQSRRKRTCTRRWRCWRRLLSHRDPGSHSGEYWRGQLYFTIICTAYLYSSLFVPVTKIKISRFHSIRVLLCCVTTLYLIPILCLMIYSPMPDSVQNLRQHPSDLGASPLLASTHSK